MSANTRNATHHELLDTLAERQRSHRADLEDLVRIPSVSAAAFDPQPVRDCAEAVRDLAAGRGFDAAELLEVDGGHPAVLAERAAEHDDAPTVLLYAHHDVQPPGDPDRWTHPPFEPTERHGRLYGRGTADDKAGIVAHVAAVDAWQRCRGGPPCHVKLLVEGEEEVGSPNLAALLAAHADRFGADALVVADTVNWQVGVPTLTTSLRGLVDAVVEVRALDHAVHSGMYGGPVPDPVTALARLLAAAVDEHGQVVIPGFADDVPPLDEPRQHAIEALPFDADRFRAEAGLLDGVPLAGDPQAHPLARLWRHPHLAVVGIDAPDVAGAANAIQPSARAKISVRLAPGQDPLRASDVLADWLARNTPFGLQVEVTPGAAAAPFEVDTSAAAVRAAGAALETAYGRPTVYAGLGGSIPFIEPMAARLGGVPVLMVGVEDPDTRAHGIDESLHLGDFERACRGQALLLPAVAEALSGAAP